MVEWIAIGELCKPITPPQKIPTKDYEAFGKYPIIDQGQQSIIGYTNDKSSLVPNDEYVLFGDHTRYVKYHKGSFAQGADGLKILKAKEKVIPRYFFYAFQNTDIPTRGYSRHWSIAKALLIPIPSLAEQNRIVGILDTFTESIDNLKKQITLRKKQYEFYRDQLLDLEGKPGVEMAMSDFCLLKAGKAIKADKLSDLNEESPYPCFGGNGIRGYLPYFSHTGDFPIIGRQGALCGCVNWATGKFYATEHAVVAQGKENVMQKYLFYLFIHADLNQFKTQGAQPGLSVAKLNNLTFKIPSLSEQSRIVSILDQFESSIFNLEQQLAQRQKQYEYYRNKLLTFD